MLGSADEVGGSLNHLEWLSRIADPLGLAMVAGLGLLLLLLGGRLLRPGLFLAGVVLGGGLGLRLAVVDVNGGIAGIPPLVWVIGLPIIFGILGLVLYRICLAGLLGMAMAAAGFLLTLVVLSAMSDAPITSPPDAEPSASSTVEQADEQDAGEYVDPITPVLDRIKSLASSKAEEQVREQVRSELDTAARALASRIDTGVLAATGWLWARASGLAPTVRNLALLVAVVLGLLGFLFGLASPDRVARIGTAIVGDWLLTMAAAATWNGFAGAESTLPPMALLVLWGLISSIGGVVQCTKKSSRADESS